jgi:hypothetical protein
MPKQRKIFSMRNFLGLDRENKPLKVAPFRASDGYNFEIDSNTLKTREGFVIDSFIETDMASGDSVIDWYQYNGITLYVTEQSFYAVGNETKNLKTGTNVISFGLPLTNLNKRPLFREEKNALFIFGLDAILVFSLMYAQDGSIDKYVFYDLKSKPTNPFQAASGETPAEPNWQIYEDLPKPYEPTLFIGDNAFEDINLLSDVSKYRLFANQQTDDGFVKYFLPTHFDPTKHGRTQTVIDNIELDFYERAYEDLNVFPIFLGVDGENFDYSLSNFGPLFTTYTNIEIEDTFYPDLPFEFFKDYSPLELDPPQDPIVGDKITAIVGLTKQDFFTLRIKNSSQSVFEYMLNVIKQEQVDLLINQVVTFTLPIEHQTIYRPVGDYSTIQEKVIERDTITVYVQLKKFDSQSFITTPVNDEISTSSVTNVVATSNDYPSYPPINATLDHEIELTTISVPNTNFSQNAINAMEAWIDINKANGTYADNDVIGLKIKMFYPFTIPVSANINVLTYIVARDFSTTQFPSYPSFSNPNNYPVDDILLPLQQTLEHNNPNVSSQLISLLYGSINQLFDSQDMNGFGYVQYRFYTYDFNSGFTYYNSAVCFIEFQKTTTELRHLRASASSFVTLDITQAPSSTTLYNISFNQERNWFELEVRDYFYDYNQEPSIDVKVTFLTNPDYDIIAQSRFGAFFGSEDRLFLAGHPDYPNIDRYNVSNDLLGDNVENQSYELSYFPSKNYRVLGGKGRINGYVVATDTQLYITKEEYPNDSKLFIRERSLDNNGIAGYREFKTSVTETPLNDRCIVRFYNDILMLTKNGLYGVEISSNVLTNERLLKLRSGFINKDLKTQIANTSNENIFIVENNQMMYIFVGKTLYVGDSRYISKNENSQIENLSYELIKWIVPEQYVMAKFEDNVLYTIGDESEVKLKLQEADEDDVAIYMGSVLTEALVDIDSSNDEYKGYWLTIAGAKAQEFYDNFAKTSIYIPQNNYATQVIAKKTQDYLYTSFSNGIATLTIQNNSFRFANIENGDTIYFVENDYTTRQSYVVSEVTSTQVKLIAQDDTWFVANQSSGMNYISIEASKKDLYPVIAIKNLTSGSYHFKYSIYKNQEVFKYDLATQATQAKTKIEELYFYNEILLYGNGLVSGIMNVREPIVFLWQSAMTDFGNNLMEKTIYRANIYATKKATSSDLYFGYKTMRRFKSLEDTNIVAFDLNVDISNLSNLDDLDFTSFAINTFEEFGMSLPMKENNFLYIQFIVKGEGRLELNALELIYKDNRRLKSIG